MKSTLLRVRGMANHSCVDNNNSMLFYFCHCCFLFSESFVRLFIWGKNLEKKKKEAMEKILTQVVETYMECNKLSQGNLKEDLKSFTDHIDNVYGVNLVTVGKGSVIIILDCPTVDSLEHLWNDYLAGHLDNLAERYLVTNEIKKKLNLETVCLKTTIVEEDYLNCKEALKKLRSTYSGEFKQSVWEVKLCTCRCSSMAFQLKKCTMYKRRMGGSTIIMIIIIIIIITTTLIMIIITLFGILYTSKGALHHCTLDMVKITKIQNICTFRYQVKVSHDLR